MPKLLRIILGVAVAVVAAVLAREGVDRLMGSSMEQQLQEAAAEITRSVPRRIDTETTLVGARADGREFHYQSQVDHAEAMPGTDALTAQLRQSACGGTLRATITQGARYVYEYRAADGRALAAVTIDRCD